jgi:hypothetical protein
MRLVKLIEAHSGELCRDLTEQIVKSERTSDFRRIPAEALRLAASEVYRNLGEWLLQKTESDIEARFRAACGGGNPVASVRLGALALAGPPLAFSSSRVIR